MRCWDHEHCWAQRLDEPSRAAYKRLGFGYLLRGRRRFRLPSASPRERLLDERRRDSDVGSLIGGAGRAVSAGGRGAISPSSPPRSPLPADIALIAERDLDILPGSIVERHQAGGEPEFCRDHGRAVGTNVVGAAQRLGDAVDVFGSGHGDARYEALGMVSGVAPGRRCGAGSVQSRRLGEPVDRRRSSSRFEQQSRFDGVVPARIDAGGDLALAAGRDLAVAALQAAPGAISIFMPGVILPSNRRLRRNRRACAIPPPRPRSGLDLGWSVAGGQSLGLSPQRESKARPGQPSPARRQARSIRNCGRASGSRSSNGNDALIAGAQLRRARDPCSIYGGDLQCRLAGGQRCAVAWLFLQCRIRPDDRPDARRRFEPRLEPRRRARAG